MKKIFLAILLIGCSPFLFAQDADKSGDQQDYKKMLEEAMKMKEGIDGAEVQAVIKRISGSVGVKSSEGEGYIPIEHSYYYPLDPDDSIKTGSDGYAEIYYNNGAVMKLDRNTELEIKSLDQDESNLFLKIGALVAKIDKTIKQRVKMTIGTPTAVCAVRGTEFAVEYSNFNKESLFGVFDEGQISVTPEEKERGGGAQEILVNHGDELSVVQDSRRYKVSRMSRLLRHKNALIAAKKNLQLYQKKWKRMTPERRQNMRNLLMRKKNQKSLSAAGTGKKEGSSRTMKKKSIKKRSSKNLKKTRSLRKKATKPVRKPDPQQQQQPEEGN